MKLNNLAFVFGLLTAITICFDATAQFGTYNNNIAFSDAAQINRLLDHGRSREAIPNVTIGYTLPYRSFFLEGKFEGYDKKNISDNKFTKKIAMKSIFGGSVGINIPLSPLSDNSALCLTQDIVFYIFEGQNVNLQPSQNINIKMLEAYFAGIPISIDYKVGADAAMDRQYKFMYGFGAGVNFNTTILVTDKDAAIFANSRDMSFNASPFIKAEIGYFLGIAFKLRATFTYFNKTCSYKEHEDNGVPNTVQQLKLNYSGQFYSSPEFAITFIIMPGSHVWDIYK